MEIVNQSLWAAKEPQATYAKLLQNRTADVAVIGGGITGLTTALLLAQGGVKVVVLEARRIGRGTSGYTTGKVTALQTLIYQRLEKNFGVEGTRLYAGASTAALEEVATLVSSLSIDCGFERRVNYTYAETANDVESIEAEARAAERAGLPVELTRETDLPFEVAAAVRLQGQGQMDAYRYCEGLAAAIVAAGGEVYEKTQVTDVADEGDTYLLSTSTGSLVAAERVVVATLLPILDRGGFFAKASPSRTYLAAYRTGDEPPLHDMYISAASPTRTLRNHGAYTLIGGQTHRVGDEPDTRRCYDAIRTWASERLGLSDPAYQWSAQDYMPLDDKPYIGRMPRGRSTLTLATGFGKWGLTGGTIAAMILRDDILGRANPWATFFAATRLDVRNSTMKFVKDNLEVAKHFVGDRASNPSERDIDTVGRDDGAIATMNGEKVAAYRDSSGELHKLSPVCPHMGCHLTWNTAEKSWDCPCHGSRFDAFGAYLQGPATSDMDKKR